MGDITKEAMLSKLITFKEWNNSALHLTEPTLPVIEKTKIYFVNKPNAPQSEIRVGYVAIPFDATGNYFKTSIMNKPLGGSLTCRINMNLREKHGYTYYSRGYFLGDKYPGPYTVFTSVRADVTDSSVIQIMKEIRNYADKGITEKELQETKMATAQRETQLYETPSQKAAVLKNILDYGLEKDFTLKQSEILKSLTVAEINELAKKYLPYDKMHIVVVGDKVKVFDKLKKIGYEVVELDANGDMVK